MAGEQTNETGDKGAAGEQLQQLQQQLAEAQKQLGDLKSAKEDLQKKLDDADKELLSPEYLEYIETKKGAPPKGEGTKEKVNFDEMTPAQIAEYFEGKYKGDIKSAVDEVAKRMDMMEDAIGKTAAQIDLTITGIKHADFGSALDTPANQRSAEQKALIDTVYKVAQENPTWGAERCYRQAKLELKASAEEKETIEKEKAEKERKTLTEKPGAAESIFQEKQLSKDQAASVAWKAAFGNKASVD